MPPRAAIGAWFTSRDQPDKAIIWPVEKATLSPDGLMLIVGLASAGLPVPKDATRLHLNHVNLAMTLDLRVRREKILKLNQIAVLQIKLQNLLDFVRHMGALRTPAVGPVAPHGLVIMIDEAASATCPASWSCHSHPFCARC